MERQNASVVESAPDQERVKQPRWILYRFVTQAMAQDAHIFASSERQPPNWLRDLQMTSDYCQTNVSLAELGKRAQFRAKNLKSRPSQIIKKVLAILHARSSTDLQQQSPLADLSLRKQYYLRFPQKNADRDASSGQRRISRETIEKARAAQTKEEIRVALAKIGYWQYAQYPDLVFTITDLARQIGFRFRVDRLFYFLQVLDQGEIPFKSIIQKKTKKGLRLQAGGIYHVVLRQQIEEVQIAFLKNRKLRKRFLPQPPDHRIRSFAQYQKNKVGQIRALARKGFEPDRIAEIIAKTPSQVRKIIENYHYGTA